MNATITLEKGTDWSGVVYVPLTDIFIDWGVRWMWDTRSLFILIRVIWLAWRWRATGLFFLVG
jgi:hypothetical protein